jgi:hypothetical protein
MTCVSSKCSRGAAWMPGDTQPRRTASQFVPALSPESPPSCEF